MPGRDELYARTCGLLEPAPSHAAASAPWASGSVGTATAVELAKAGVRDVVLLDPDVLEPANVARHACGLSDLGRPNEHAVRDAVLDRNPYATVVPHELDVTEDPARTLAALHGCDLIIGATDGNQSRAAINQAALELGVTALFGRALARAAGGRAVEVSGYESGYEALLGD